MRQFVLSPANFLHAHGCMKNKILILTILPLLTVALANCSNQGFSTGSKSSSQSNPQKAVADATHVIESPLVPTAPRGRETRVRVTDPDGTESFIDSRQLDISFEDLHVKADFGQTPKTVEVRFKLIHQNQTIPYLLNGQFAANGEVELRSAESSERQRNYFSGNAHCIERCQKIVINLEFRSQRRAFNKQLVSVIHEVSGAQAQTPVQQNPQAEQTSPNPVAEPAQTPEQRAEEEEMAAGEKEDTAMPGEYPTFPRLVEALQSLEPLVPDANITNNPPAPVPAPVQGQGQALAPAPTAPAAPAAGTTGTPTSQPPAIPPESQGQGSPSVEAAQPPAANNRETENVQRPTSALRPLPEDHPNMAPFARLLLERERERRRQLGESATAQAAPPAPALPQHQATRTPPPPVVAPAPVAPAPPGQTPAPAPGTQQAAPVPTTAPPQANRSGLTRPQDLLSQAAAAVARATCSDLVQRFRFFPCSNLGEEYQGRAYGFYNGNHGNRNGIENSTALPATFRGLISINRERHRYFGAGITILFLKTLSTSLANAGLPIIQVNDIAKQGGGQVGEHASHKNGLDIDVPIIRSGRSFDAAKNWEMLKRMYDYQLIHRIYTSNENKAAVCRVAREMREHQQYRLLFKSMQYWSGHGGHFHLRLHCTKHNLQECRTENEPPDQSECAGDLVNS